MLRTISISFIAIISTFIGRQAFAQSVVTTSEVNMMVEGGIVLTKVRDMHVGAVIQGTTNVNINPLTSGSSAYFTLSSSPNSSETVTFSATNLTSGTETITFTGTIAGSNEPIQPHATLIKDGGAITTNGSGQFYIWAEAPRPLQQANPPAHTRAVSRYR